MNPTRCIVSKIPVEYESVGNIRTYSRRVVNSCKNHRSGLESSRSILDRIETCWRDSQKNLSNSWRAGNSNIVNRDGTCSRVNGSNVGIIKRIKTCGKTTNDQMSRRVINIDEAWNRLGGNKVGIIERCELCRKAARVCNRDIVNSCNNRRIFMAFINGILDTIRTSCRRNSQADTATSIRAVNKSNVNEDRCVVNSEL